MNQPFDSSKMVKIDHTLEGPSFQSWGQLISTLISYKLSSGENAKIPTYSVAELFRNRWQISIYYATIYLLLVYLGTKWMKNRQPYNLRLPLAIWSGALSIFSFLGALTAVPEFVSILYRKGFVATYCNNAYIYQQDCVFWYTIFSLSKVAELVDTGFIVLRKQKLILLHWIHHMLTLVYVFYIFGFMAATARWMVTMNLMVHAIMYGYYCLRALRIPISKSIAMSITVSQIVQMIFGLIIHTHIVIRLMSNGQCDCPMPGAVWALLMYLLYFYFFVKFFFDSYFSNKSKPDKLIGNGQKSSYQVSKLDDSDRGKQGPYTDISNDEDGRISDQDNLNNNNDPKDYDRKKKL